MYLNEWTDVDVVAKKASAIENKLKKVWKKRC